MPYSRSITWVQIDDFSPSQIGVSSTRMFAAITLSKMRGQSSFGQPCSVMSGYTPEAISWSTARISSTPTPLRRMISMEISARPSVFDTSGDRFRVQLTNSADRSLKSVVFVSHSSACLFVSSVMPCMLHPANPWVKCRRNRAFHPRVADRSRTRGENLSPNADKPCQRAAPTVVAWPSR